MNANELCEYVGQYNAQISAKHDSRDARTQPFPTSKCLTVLQVPILTFIAWIYDTLPLIICHIPIPFDHVE